MFDFLVIGGGIAGISAGARLAPYGTTCVLETESALGYHASGRSAALFEETYGLWSTVALNRASHGYLATAHGGVLSERGLMLVAGNGQEATFESDLAHMPLPEISLDAAQALVPILKDEAVTRVAYHSDAWDIDTDRLVQNFARDLRAEGGEVRTSASAQRIDRTDSGWAVETSTETIEARILVNAAGAWADAVAQMAGVAQMGLTPFRRSMARLPAPGGHDVSGWPMLLGAGETWYAKPDAGALLVSPADEDPIEPHDAWADDMVVAEGLARYEAHVTEPVTRVLTTWAGLRTFSPDRHLVIGPDPTGPGFFWCAGQGGYGMQSSPAASECLAAHVTGAAQPVAADVVAALSPARFRKTG